MPYASDCSSRDRSLPFFIAGAGPTVLRQVILSNAIALLLIASLVLFRIFTLKRVDFFFWYAVSLAVLAIGLVAALIIPTLGSPVNWISRGMQYIGAGFALYAVITAGRIGRNRGLSLEEMLGVFFSNAEAGYQALVEAATDAIVVFDATDRVIVWNGAAEKMFGYSRDEAIGSSFIHLAIPEEYAGAVRCEGSTTTPDGDLPASKTLEILARRKDRGTFPAELTVSRRHIAGTWVCTSIIRDITDRNLAEEALRANEEWLRLALDAARMTAWEYDPKTLKVTFSENAEAVLGLPSRFKNSDEGYSLIHPDEMEQHRSLVDKAIAAGSSYVSTYRHNRGEEVIWLEEHGRASVDSAGQVRRLVGVVQNIPDRKRMEAMVIRNSQTLSELIEGAPFGIYIIDSQFRIAMMNAGSQAGAFRNVRPLIGRDFNEAMHILWPDDVAGSIIGAFRHTLETGEPYYAPRFTSQRHDLVTVESYEWELHRMTLPDGQYGVICYYFDSTKLRTVEDALRESEERLRLAQVAGNVGIWDWNHLTGEVKWTPELEAIFGLEPGSVRSYADFRARVHPDDIENVEKMQAAAVEQHTPFAYEYRFRRPTGEIGWIYCRGGAVYDKREQPIREFGINIDITDRKRVEEALCESEERTRIAVEAADLGTWSFDIATGVADHSLRHDPIFGFAEAVPAWSYEISIQHMLPEFHVVAREAVEHAMKTGRVSFEAQVRWPDGSIHWINPFGRVQYDRNGCAVRMSGVVADITERRNAEERLQNLHTEIQRERDRLSSLVSSISDEVWYADTQKNFMLANPAALAEFGLGTSKIDIEKFAASLEVCRPDGSPRPVEEAPPLRALKGEKVTNQEEMIRTPVKGEIRYRQVSSNPVRDASGTIIGSVSVVRDITDSRKAEEELRESEEEFRVLTENLLSGVALIDEHGAFSIVNASFLRMFGIPADADILNVNSQDWARWQVFGEDGTPHDVDQHPVRKAAITRRAVQNQLVAMKSPSGPDLKWLLVSAEPILDAHGGIHRIICTYYDITDRKKVEEELWQSEERFRLALRNATVSVALQDKDLVYQWAYNQTTRRTDEILGLKDADLFAPEDVAWLTPLKRRLLETGVDAHAENGLTSNGRRVYLDLYLEPLRNPAGEIYGIGIAAVNQTDLKLAEAALRESEEKYRNLFMNMTEEVHFWKLVRDPEGRIVTWRLVDANPPTLKTWGRTREEIVGKTTDEIFGPGATGHYQKIVQKIMTEGVPHAYDDFFPNLDRYFRFTSVPFGEYFITTGADITAIKKAENELMAKNEDLNALNEELTSTGEELHQNLEELSRREQDLNKALAEKEVLLSEIHPRVKNNLTAFISLLSLEGSTEDSPAGRLLKQDLQNRARSMALVHETLYRTNLYDEVDMGMYLTTLIDQVANSFRTTRPVRTVVEASGVMLDIGRATPTGLVVNELITNSFKYAFPADGTRCETGGEVPCTISVSFTKEDGQYLLRVADNGVGLPPGFDIATTKTLGLKLVNFLAKHQMRAAIEVNTHKGAEFIFRFEEQSP